MNRVRIHLVAAARPNFMKVAPLHRALKQEDWCQPILVHTGQHYDSEMSEVFLRDLGLPDPDMHLGAGSGTHAEQTAAVMLAYEKVCLEQRPDWVVVVGDVNSTMACTLVAKKLHLPVAHLEAGLRSGDRDMPEEINRIVTDGIADLLWTPSPDADENLLNEGVASDRIVRVGNIMIDSYSMLVDKIELANVPKQFGLEEKEYGVVTLHRPSNVDKKETLEKLVDALLEASRLLTLVFPIHPRTAKKLAQFQLDKRLGDAHQLRLVKPMGYIQFMSLVRQSRLVITDSGGLQEETTYLGIPCLTLRSTTERPITVSQGTNRLVSIGDVPDNVTQVIDGKWPKGSCPALWDGCTAARVAASLRAAMRKQAIV